MFKGKKGFDRLVYACKNVLNEPLSWLFCNLSPKGKEGLVAAIFQPTASASRKPR